ncbi:Uncharacterised protein [Streptococcus pneumoniae]|nr:Uncharacterised protein [Streptococcus pneumoniae]CAG5953993.1 Uncharacterised protein [Streptococcus pneumoniae]CRF29523.1 Uncharacterised protein [Streptococcus pneumoniae]VRD81914.1 Uncharacterised protein [Streptococcus pneumoniae]
MSTTTKFNRVVTDSHDTNFLAVFLTKEGHSSHFFSSVNIRFNCLHFKCFPNFLVDLLFNRTKFLSSYCLEVGKVKAKEFNFVKRSCLCCVVSKDIVKGSVKQMSRSVVFHDTVTAIAINCQGIFLVQGKRCKDFNCMKGLTIWGFLNIGHSSHNLT